MTYALQVVEAHKTFFADDDEHRRPWWRIWQRRPRRLVTAISGITVLWFKLDMSHANLLGGFVVLVAAVLPLLSTERGPQATHIIQGLLLLCSSVYYQVTVLPGWLQPIAKLNPATFALDAIRATWIGGAALTDVWPELLKLTVTGAVLVPIGLLIFQAGERYALRTGKLKRNG